MLANGGDGKDSRSFQRTVRAAAAPAVEFCFMPRASINTARFKPEAATAAAFAAQRRRRRWRCDPHRAHHANGSFDNTGGTQSVLGGTSGPGSGGESGDVGVIAIQSDTPAATPVIRNVRLRHRLG